MIALFLRLTASLSSIPLVVLACVFPAIASDSHSGVLRWHVESKSEGSTPLAWIEDREDWIDMPKDVPLVLFCPDQDPRSGR